MHEIAVWLGLTNAAGPIYSFWSGFGSDLPIVAGVLLFTRKFNCHAKGCLRLGIHKVDGTHYITCRKHHPNHYGDKVPATAEDIRRAHEAANAS